jgi:hypothetical protein
MDEDNRRPRDGHGGVGLPHSTGEAGERASGEDPVEGRRQRGDDAAEGDTGGAQKLRDVYTKLRRISEKRRGMALSNPPGSHLEEPDAGNRHVRICGGPGEVTRRAIPTCARVSLGYREGKHDLKWSERAQWRKVPPGQSLASRPVASLACAAGDCGCEA